MKPLVSFLMLFAFAIAAPAQNKSTSPAAADTNKFAAALEAQISCKEKVQPAKAIRALQRAGVISRTYAEEDSINFYRVKMPLTVFGYKVLSVIAFDEDLPFERGPGTLPPTLLGILVSDRIKDVKAKLGYLESQSVIIEEHDDSPGPPHKPRMRTEIWCSR